MIVLWGPPKHQCESRFCGNLSHSNGVSFSDVYIFVRKATTLWISICTLGRVFAESCKQFFFATTMVVNMTQQTLLQSCRPWRQTYAPRHKALRQSLCSLPQEPLLLALQRSGVHTRRGTCGLWSGLAIEQCPWPNRGRSQEPQPRGPQFAPEQSSACMNRLLGGKPALDIGLWNDLKT